MKITSIFSMFIVVITSSVALAKSDMDCIAINTETFASTSLSDVQRPIEIAGSPFISTDSVSVFEKVLEQEGIRFSVEKKGSNGNLDLSIKIETVAPKQTYALTLLRNVSFTQGESFFVAAPTISRSIKCVTK